MQGFPQAKTPKSKWQSCLKPGRVRYGTAEDLAECGTETLIEVSKVFVVDVYVLHVDGITCMVL